MNLIKNIQSFFRYELPIDQEFVEREKRNMSKDRKKWLLDYIKLYPENPRELNLNQPISLRKPKNIIVKVKKRANEDIAIEKLEEKLKFELHYRSCDKGANYKRYYEGGKLVGEVTPIDYPI